MKTNRFATISKTTLAAAAMIAIPVQANAACIDAPAYGCTQAASAYEQALKARFDQQKQIYDRANAQAAAAKDVETARIFATQATAAAAEGNRILDVTILSGRKRQGACVSRHPPAIGKPIVHLDSDHGLVPADAISAASVPAFKGLENEVLILTDLPPLEPMTPWVRSIFYVGMTRAKSKLFALVDKGFLNVRTR
jgi:hypothetical protein